MLKIIFGYLLFKITDIILNNCGEDNFKSFFIILSNINQICLPDRILKTCREKATFPQPIPEK